MNNYMRGLKEDYVGSKDLIEAMKYFKKSADLGNSSAKSNLINL
jgi:TPR repeat protein